MNVNSEHSQAIENPNGLNSDTVSRRLFLKICTAFSGALAVATSSFRHAEGLSKTVGGNPEVVGSRVEREKTRLVNEILKKVTIYDTGIIDGNGEIQPVEETEIFQRLTKREIMPEALEEHQQKYRSDSNQLYEDDPMAWVALFLMPGKHDHGKQVVDLLKKHVASLAQVAETNIGNPTFVSIDDEVESKEEPIKKSGDVQEITKTLENRGETSKVQYKAQIFDVTTGDAASIEKLDNLPKLVSLSGQIGTVQVEVLTHERVPVSRQITPEDIRRAINHNFIEQKFYRINFDKELGFFDFKGQVVNLEDIQSYELTYSSPNGENDKTVTFSNDLKEIAVGKDEFLSESGGGEWAPRVTQIV
nr:hypothetical protein [Candidatus Woesebacteria bacterium]